MITTQIQIHKEKVDSLRSLKHGVFNFEEKGALNKYIKTQLTRLEW